jgi:hypothetical protein
MEELLTCKYKHCNKFYKDPIRLPCIDKSICSSHLEDLFVNNSKTKIMCCFCNVIHNIPKDGLKVNEDLKKLLAFNIHLSEKHKEAKLLNIKSVIIANQINEKLRESHNTVDSHIEEIKLKIKEQREACKNEIDSIADEMLNELGKYENECKLNLIKKEILNENIEINDDWEFELRTPKLAERRLNELVKDMKKFIRENETYLNNLKNDLFVGKICDFVPAKSNEKKKELIFGTLKIKVLNKISSKVKDQFNDTFFGVNKLPINHHISSSSSLAINSKEINEEFNTSNSNLYHNQEQYQANLIFDKVKERFKISKTFSNSYLSTSPVIPKLKLPKTEKSYLISPKLKIRTLAKSKERF